MKTHRFLAALLFIVGLVIGIAPASAQFGGGSNLILVSSTDFSIPAKEKDFYSSFDELNDADTYGGIIKPTIEAGAGYGMPDSAGTKATAAKAYSAFLKDKHYALVNNPIKLDSNRLDDSKGWGAVFSLGEKSFNSNPGMELMSYEVAGLKSTGLYSIEIEYCNPLSKDYLNPNSDVNVASKKGKGPYLESGYNAAIKVGVNTTGGTYVGSPGSSPGCKVWKYTFDGNSNSDMASLGGGVLKMHIYANQANAWEAIAIKSIKVYAEIEAKISGPEEVCSGGEQAVLSLNATYRNCKYQWYANGKPISGATGLTYLHTSSNSEGETTYTVKVTSGKTEITSEPFVVKDVACCVGDNGQPMSRKLIWQDDFGTFTSKGNYWVWDYTDINEPKKIKKTTKDSKGWGYKLDYTIPGAQFWNGVDGDIDDGYYIVAGNVTCQWNDLSGGDGTQWGWPAMSFNGKKPGENGWTFVPDHTYQGEEWGGMLYLNCGNKPGETIYSHEINGLCDKALTVKCYVNNFSDAKEPVIIQIRLTDLNDASNVKTSTEIVRYADGRDGVGWKEVSVPITLTTPAGENSAGVKFEIISKQGCSTGGKCEANLSGNDLILDDIQVYACASPSVQLYFDLDTHAEVTQDCGGDTTNLYVEVSKMIESYYKADARYLFQWNRNPEDKKGWKNIGEVTNESKALDMSKIFAELDPKDPKDTLLYFRVVLGYEATLKSTTYFNPDEACASYTVSDPIKAVKACPNCTQPKKSIKYKDKSIVIVSEDGKEAKKTDGKTTYTLCFGESVTLSQEIDITPAPEDFNAPDFKGYSIAWFKDKMTGLTSSTPYFMNDKIEDFVVKFDDKALAGTSEMYILYADDASYLNAGCESGDTVYVKYEKIPTDTIPYPDAFCEGNGKVVSTLKGYSIAWFDSLSAILQDDIEGSWFEKLKGKPTPYDFYYTLTDKETKCVGEIQHFVVDVHEVPENPEEAEISMVVTGKIEALNRDEYELELGEVPSNITELWYTDVTGGTGSTKTPQIDRTDEAVITVYRSFFSKGNCESERVPVKITVKSAPDPYVIPWSLCEGDKMTEAEILALIKQDDDYDLVWYDSESAAKGTGKSSVTDLTGDAATILGGTTTPGEYTFWVANRGKNAPNPESDKVPVKITVWGVKKPDVEPLKYCSGVEADPLTFTKVTDPSAFYDADAKGGFIWSYGSTDLTKGVSPTPDTKLLSAGTVDVVYSVRQVLTLSRQPLDPNAKADIKQCESKQVDLNISITKVLPPTKELTVSYVKSEGEEHSKFEHDIMEKNSNVVNYDSNTQSVLWASSETGTPSTTVPTPLYDKTKTDPVEQQYFWATIMDNASKCMSEPAKVTVTITSTPAPKTTNLAYCEGEPVATIEADLKNSAEKNDGGGKVTNISDYELYWFGPNEKDAANNAYTNGVGSKSPNTLPTVTTETIPADDNNTTYKDVVYYVVQSDGTTTSPASEVVVTFYANPHLTAKNPLPVCEKSIDLTTDECWSVDNRVKLDVTANYVDDSGSEVTKVAKSISEKGLYKVQASFTVPGTPGGTCMSEVIDLEVDIQTLNVSFDASPTTCPDSKINVDLDIEYGYNTNANNSHEVTYTYSDGVKTDNGTITANDGVVVKESVESGTFSGGPGDKFEWKVNVTAGECTREVTGTVTLGDGPLEGNVVYTEAKNKDLENGYTAKIKAKNSINTCGGDLSIDVSDLTTTSGSIFQWYSDDSYDDSKKLHEGSVYPFSGEKPTTVYLRYTNKCFAYASFSINPVPIKIVTDAQEAVVECESDPNAPTKYFLEVEVECPVSNYQTSWYRKVGGTEEKTSNITKVLDFKALDKDAHEGLYTFEAVIDGCVAKKEMVDITVKKYVRFEPEDYVLYGTNKDTSYIAIAGESVTVPLKYTYPSGGTGVSVVWENNGSVVSGTSTSYEIASVDRDYKVHAVASGTDLCSSEINVQVLREAKLKMKIGIDPKMCLRDEKKLSIDTTGTGRFLYPEKMKFVVNSVEYVDNTPSEPVEVKNFTRLIDGKLEKIVSPRHTTKYSVEFEYEVGDQSIKLDTTITVFNFQVKTMPLKTCEGSDIPVVLTAVPDPAESQLSWFDSNDSNQPDKNKPLGETSAIVTPKFEGTSDRQTSSIHRYFVLAYNDEVTCESFFPLDVTVYRPLEGEINDTLVCEGRQVRIDAGSYNAQKYEWESSSKPGDVTMGRYKTDLPSETTTYTVKMTRGACYKEDHVTATVKSNPHIASIDSMGYRDRLIVMDESTGTAPYYFSIDDSELSTNTFIQDLRYSPHTLKIVDANGCTTSEVFEVPAPGIIIPPITSPNGDGDNDYWTASGISETYPQAEFTIFDRWGKVVARFKGADQGWDGTYNGNDLPSTDYWYEIVVREIDKVYTGHFTLIRR